MSRIVKITYESDSDSEDDLIVLTNKDIKYTQSLISGLGLDKFVKESELLGSDDEDEEDDFQNIVLETSNKHSLLSTQVNRNSNESNEQYNKRVLIVNKLSNSVFKTIAEDISKYVVWYKMDANVDPAIKISYDMAVREHRLMDL